MASMNKLVKAGKRFLVMGSVMETVRAFQETPGMTDKKYAGIAEECGEAFFCCGKAVLDLARMEHTVLGSSLETVPEEEEPKVSNIFSQDKNNEKNGDESRVQVYKAMTEKKTEDAEATGYTEKKDNGAVNPEATEKINDNNRGQEELDGTENKDAEDEEKPDGVNESASDKQKEAEDKEEKMETEAEEQDKDAEKDSDNQEVGSLQLAWEMLEVAKSIYKRNETKEDQLMVAQAHFKLGEVAVEAGNYSQALEDFTECMELQMKHLEPHDRQIAETFYQLGMTYSLNNQHGLAIQSFNNSIFIIESRLDYLQALLDEGADREFLGEERKELEELLTLLPEIQGRTDVSTECLYCQRHSAKIMVNSVDKRVLVVSPGGTVNTRSFLNTLQFKIPVSFGSDDDGTSSAQTSDDSHLVGRKRKPDESPEVESGEIKKANCEVETPWGTPMSM